MKPTDENNQAKDLVLTIRELALSNKKAKDLIKEYDEWPKHVSAGHFYAWADRAAHLIKMLKGG